jgi:cell division protein FtsN
MEHSPHDTGAQFVLDNRKLIVGFALLIVLCGTFFVIGFMEGKRQGIQRAKEQFPVNAATAPPQSSLPAAISEGSGGAQIKPLEEKSVREQLEWYKSVNKREESAAASPSRSARATEASSKADSARIEAAPAKTGSSASATKTQAPPRPRPAATSKVTYSVQVGAFRQRREAEAKASALKDRNYQYVIEPAVGAEPLFLLKVGRYESRAEAVATQLRLKKDGFSTFIKTNP